MQSGRNPSPAGARRALPALLALALALPAAEAQTPFTERADVIVVEIPVTVTRDGEPVRGLTRDDFVVLDRGRKQQIVGFEEIDLLAYSSPDAAAAAATRPLPAAARRHVLLLFDLDFSDPGAILRARRAALRLVDTALHPTDLVGVATYSTPGARLVLGFTPDRDQARAAIETLGLSRFVRTMRDPLGLVLADASAGQLPFPSGTLEGEIQDLLTSIQSEQARAEARYGILALTSAMTELAQTLATLHGRKHVIFLSEGFDSSVPLGLGVDTQAERRAIESQAESAIAGRVWEVNSDLRFGNTMTLNRLDLMSQELVRSGCTVHTVDSGGLRVEETDVSATSPGTVVASRGAHGLFLMADKTGGSFYRSYNELEMAMEKILERTSVTYLLAIQPPKLVPDGSYHRLKVRLRDRRGAEVSHRPGYHAPRPFAQQAPIERRLDNAGLILGGRDGGEIDVAVLAAPLPAGAARARVPVVIEVAGDGLLGPQRGGLLPVEIYAYALSPDGAVHDFFTSTSALDLRSLAADLRRGGFRYRDRFELPPGDYTARTLVRNGATGSFGVRSTPFRVPAAAAAEAALLPPLFPQPGAGWLGHRDAEPARPDETFTLDGEPFVPAARPTLERQRSYRLALVGYYLGAGPLAVEARLVDADGDAVAGAEAAIESRSPGSAPGEERLVIRLRLGEVAAGLFRLEITVRDRVTGGATRSSIPVAIAS